MPATATGRCSALILPGHDHPHILTDVDLLSGNNPFEIEVATRVDPCPTEVTFELREESSSNP